MQAAKAALLQAQQHLQNATNDKGGHRVTAMKLVEQALAEVETGISYDRANQSSMENQRR